MPLFDSRQPAFYSTQVYRDVLNLPYGVHSSIKLTTGIPTGRIVFFNTELANTDFETFTDNVSVGFQGTAGSTGVVAGVVKDGSTPAGTSGLTLMPGCNRDDNVTVTLLGQAIAEVQPGIAINAGTIILVNATGQVSNAGTTTVFVALTNSVGTGTVANPEYIAVLVR